jgi:hypothetical protein
MTYMNRLQDYKAAAEEEARRGDDLFEKLRAADGRIFKLEGALWELLALYAENHLTTNATRRAYTLLKEQRLHEYYADRFEKLRVRDLGQGKPGPGYPKEQL